MVVNKELNVMKMKRMTEEMNPEEDCCICRHFRMWKPQPKYCTVKKEIVDPLQRGMPCFKLRKGLPVITPIQ